MLYTKTVFIPSGFTRWATIKVGQWVTGVTLHGKPLAYRGQYLGLDQFGQPIVNLAPMKGTPKHKANNWKTQFKSNHGLRVFAIERGSMI